MIRGQVDLFPDRLELFNRGVVIPADRADRQLELPIPDLADAVFLGHFDALRGTGESAGPAADAVLRVFQEGRPDLPVRPPADKTDGIGPTTWLQIFTQRPQRMQRSLVSPCG